MEEPSAAAILRYLPIEDMEKGAKDADEALADKVVKVPEMAESISEGTLKQWSKSKML